MNQIDGVATATWCLVLTSIAGVTVAWIQLQRFNNNERVKNTLELLRRYDRDPVPFVHQGEERSITAAVAVARANSERARAFLRSFDSNGGSDVEYQLNWANVVVAINYFKSAAALWNRGLIDNDLFFSQLSPQVIETYKTFCELRTAKGLSLRKHGLGELADAAQEFMDRGPSPYD